MAFATASDVETELGRPAISDAESAQWQAWLDRVERTIRRRFTRSGYDLDAQTALDQPTAQDVIDVQVARVVDKINNPNTRQSSTTRSVDEASVTTRYESVTSGDPLDPTDDEWDALLPRAESNAFSTRPGFVPDRYW
jgi:hypothetical protein